MAVTCPDAEVLERFLVGQVPAEDWDELAAHVEICGECVRRLGQLQVVDPLLNALQVVDAAPWEPERPFEHWIVEKLIEDASDTLPESPLSEATGPPRTLLQHELQAGPNPAPAQASAPGKRLGNYELLEVLGRGGMGVVFRAEDQQLRRSAAVKMMLPALAVERTCRERFMREARSAARVESDYIVPIYHVDEDRGVPYLAMQLLRGETLEERLKRERVLPIGDVLRIGREVALGLAAAHELGLIHRDIKPANLFLERRAPAETGSDRGDSPSDSGLTLDRLPRVKILDFGLARAVDCDTQLSQTGPILGTPAYMAPEQAEGQPIDPRCDLFSLGCVLYHMATGAAPFNRATLRR